MPDAADLDETPTVVPVGPLTVEVRRPRSAAIRSDLDRSALSSRAVQPAVEERVARIEEQMPAAQSPTLSIVELPGLDVYAGARRGDDPKFAIRHGLLRTGRLSQFVTPIEDTAGSRGPNGLKPASDAYHRERFNSAVDDLFRQLAVSPRPLPPPAAGTVAEAPALLAVWMIRQNRARVWGVQRQLPVAVLSDPTGSHVEICAPDVPWQAFRTGVLEIGTKHVGVNDQFNSDAVTRFVAAVLRSATAAYPDTLLLTQAQNMRAAWSWLTNTRLQPDLLGLGGPPVPIAEFPGLRHVRVRTVDQDETPECYGVSNGEIGQPAGLWRFPVARVYASTSGKPTTQQRAVKSVSKLAAHEHQGTYRAPNRNANVWNPQLVEIFVAGLQEGDDPDHWAAMAHELRRAAPYFRDTTTLPWPLHLATQVNEYLIPAKFSAFE